MIKFNFYLVWFFLTFVTSLSFFMYGMFLNFLDYCFMIEFCIFNLNSLNFTYLLLFDYMSVMFMSVVLFISSMVIIYSYKYMGGNSNSSVRFLYLVILFVISMILMIMSPNLLSIMLGWDGLGLVSYCLVVFYMSNNSYLAGLITCLTNRIGDAGLLISISWMLSYGSWHFMFYKYYFQNMFFFLVIISCFTKSAQIPFSCWLPAAMAAPTPVSSLVHSSTLVTAGVYLSIRFYNNMYFNNFLLFLSMMTMFFSSFCANYEFDLKKIIALSTLSQLGLMMVSLLMNMVNLSFFHLLAHAMFKSLLFLCSGIFIFYMNDNQDIRLMGTVCKSMPFTTSCFNISSLSLCGIPFLSGFYSKDLIVESFMMMNMNSMIFMIMYFSLGLSSSYSIRLCYYSMIYNNKLKSLNLVFDSISYMKMSIYMLTLFSILFGSMQMWMINLDLMLITMPLNLKLLTMLMVILGFWSGLELLSMNNLFKLNFYLFNNKMWFLFSHSYLLYNMFYKLSLSYNNHLMMWGEYYGPNGLSYMLTYLSFIIQNLINNNIKLFFISFLVWFFIMI